MERRFRASIYVDIFVPTSHNDVEQDREVARQAVHSLVAEISANENCFVPKMICNPFVGGVAFYTPGNLLNPLDKEI
jgi:hypothetical protein